MGSFIIGLMLAFVGVGSAQIQHPTDHNVFVFDDNPVYTEEETSAQAIAIPIFGTIALLLLIAPFVVQARGGNIGQCAQFFWISLCNFFTVTNAIIWPNFNWMDWYNGHGYCDIQAKLFFPTFTGVACATVCITRRLALAVDPNKMQISETRRQRVQAATEDLLICFLFPVLQIALHYVVQYGRYYITAIGGCLASYDNSWPTILIMYIWPLIFSLINCYYSVLIIYRLRQHRHQVAKFLGNDNKNLAMFLRLFGNSLLLVLIYTPVIVYFTAISVNIQWVAPAYTETHTPEAMSGVLYYPDLGPRTFDRWTNIVMTFFIFLFFGTGTHAMETYRSWLILIGLGKIWPSLTKPTERREDSTPAKAYGWTSHWSLVNRSRRYFESHSRSQDTGSAATVMFDTRDEFGLSSRKGSLLPQYIQHAWSSPASTFASSSVQGASTHTESTAYPIPIHLRNETESPLRSKLGRLHSHTYHGVSSTANASKWLAQKISSHSTNTTPNTEASGKAPTVFNQDLALPNVFSGKLS